MNEVDQDIAEALEDIRDSNLTAYLAADRAVLLFRRRTELGSEKKSPVRLEVAAPKGKRSIILDGDI